LDVISESTIFWEALVGRGGFSFAHRTHTNKVYFNDYIHNVFKKVLCNSEVKLRCCDLSANYISIIYILGEHMSRSL